MRGSSLVSRPAVRTVQPGWTGERFPPGTRVQFQGPHGVVEGRVMELRAHHAVVACGGSGRWKVGYGRLNPRSRYRRRERWPGHRRWRTGSWTKQEAERTGKPVELRLQPHGPASRGLPLQGATDLPGRRALPEGRHGRDTEHAAARDRARHRGTGAPPQRALEADREEHRVHGRPLHGRPTRGRAMGRPVPMRDGVPADAKKPQDAGLALQQVPHTTELEDGHRRGRADVARTGGGTEEQR